MLYPGRFILVESVGYDFLPLDTFSMLILVTTADDPLLRVEATLVTVEVKFPEVVNPLPFPVIPRNMLKRLTILRIFPDISHDELEPNLKKSSTETKNGVWKLE